MSALLLLAVGGLLACKRGKGADEDGDAGPDPDDDSEWTDDFPFGPGGTAPCGAVANLEIVPLDIWGRDLGAAGLTLNHDPTWVEDPDAGPGVVIVRYGEVAVDLQVIWQADDHRQNDFVVSYDGRGGFDFTTPDDGRLATSFQVRRIEDVDCPITTVYVGLDHRWFAATGRAPTLNRVDLAMDGEEQWEGVSADLEETTGRVSWATWWWQSDFELLRPEGVYSMSDATRWSHTSMGHLQALPGTEQRILINRFWDENSDWAKYLNTDSWLRDAAEARGDDLEVMLQGNPTEVPITGEYAGTAADYDFGSRVLENPRYAGRAIEAAMLPVPVALSVQVASYHQKFVVMDGLVAWVSGMNVKSTDWDTHDHLVYEPRRMNYDATTAEREAVEAKEEKPDLGPRKDYGIRVEGPAARDVEEVFWERWETALDGHDMYSENASPFELDEAGPEPADGVPTQVVVTLPEPWAEMSIQESHAKAILEATEYIYIEDQYFRAPLMNEHLIQAMDDNPDLRLIVVTKDVSDYDGGAKYTYLSDATLRQRYPDRYLLLQLKTADLYLDEGVLWDDIEVVVDDMDTHSKIRIIDDVYLSVGSCNFNNRGYKYEGEMNVSVYDEETSTTARRRVFENLVGPEWDHLLTDDAINNFDVLAMVAEDNTDILDWWEDHADDLSLASAAAQWEVYRPSGFVYPLEISSDYVFDVGPDAF